MTKVIKTVILVVLVSTVLITSSGTMHVNADNPTYNLTGTWLFNDNWQGTAYPHLVTISTFNPDGTFSGTGYHIGGPETEDISGQLSGNSISFHWITTSEVSNGITIDGTGTVTSDSYMSGTGFQSGPYGPITWDATKQTTEPVAAFTSYNLVEGDAVEGPHMAGGKIVFVEDASNPSGTVANYDWEFKNKDTDKIIETYSTIVECEWYTIIFPEPEVYTATLTVTGTNGQKSNATETIDLTLKPGDLILLRSGGIYADLFDNILNTYTHVGMYVGEFNGIHYMVESAVGVPGSHLKDGVQLTTFDRWTVNNGETYATVVRVNIPQGTIDQAVAWAMSKATSNPRLKYDMESIFNGLKYPGDWINKYPAFYKQVDSNDKNLDSLLQQHMIKKSEAKKWGDAYYCSELVWAAYYSVSNGAIDLSAGYGGGPIPPDGLLASQYTSSPIQWHHEHNP